MSKPTTTRHKQVGDYVAMVTTVTSPFGMTVHFQVYEVAGSGRTVMVREEWMSGEMTANQAFNKWVKENE